MLGNVVLSVSVLRVNARSVGFTTCVGNFHKLKVFIMFYAATRDSCPQVHGKCELLFRLKLGHQFCAREEDDQTIL